MNGMHHAGAGGAPTAALPTKRRWRVEPRHQIVMACFLATLAMYVERVGFSIAFTELAKSATLDESVKGTVLSAFFWGYALSQARPRRMGVSADLAASWHAYQLKQACMHAGPRRLGSPAVWRQGHAHHLLHTVVDRLVVHAG